MRKKSVGLVSLVLAAGLGTTLGVPAVSAAPAHTPTRSPGVAADRSAPSDELANPAEEKKRALREQAITGLLDGTSKAKVEKRGASTVVKVGRSATARPVNGKGVRAAAPRSQDQYVELSREKTDKIFVILAEFGDKRDPKYPDQDTDPATPGPTTFDGPLNNEIPAPDRSQGQLHRLAAGLRPPALPGPLLRSGGAAGSGGDTESLKTVLRAQSSGRYSVDGTVTDWVKVPYNEARYGRSNGYPCAGNVCSNTWDLVRDGVTQWVADQKAAGRTDAEIKTAAERVRQVGPQRLRRRRQLQRARRLHRPLPDRARRRRPGRRRPDRRARTPSGRTAGRPSRAPARGPAYNPDGGTQIGDTGIWVADYTIQPENGGRERVRPRVRPRPRACPTSTTPRVRPRRATASRGGR